MKTLLPVIYANVPLPNFESAKSNIAFLFCPRQLNIRRNVNKSQANCARCPSRGAAASYKLESRRGTIDLLAGHERRAACSIRFCVVLCCCQAR